MSRVSILARFLKGNMPFGTVPKKPVLTNENAWDLAAFINSQSRPEWNGGTPFPSIDNKPFDYPIGPYSDSYTNEQHKYGPFEPIVSYWKEKNKFMTNATGI
jgi:thiosulfate dehydrogenase